MFGGNEALVYEKDEEGREEKEKNLPVSQICKRTSVSVSVSTTRLVMKEAPTVEVT